MRREKLGMASLRAGALLHHEHGPAECGAVSASFAGHARPLRHQPTIGSWRPRDLVGRRRRVLSRSLRAAALASGVVTQVIPSLVRRAGNAAGGESDTVAKAAALEG
jgi:hypothetical protein